METKKNDDDDDACPHQKNQLIKMLVWKLPITTFVCFPCFPYSNLTNKSLPAPQKNWHVFQELKKGIFLSFLHFQALTCIMDRDYARVRNCCHCSATSKCKWGTLVCHACWKFTIANNASFNLNLFQRQCAERKTARHSFWVTLFRRNSQCM